ncbi:MAG: CPBP family intramembrane metalloprotease [Oscillospiraceae bacterium]|nr:CPBP family intramembrane metalloprotease [Oscillospiraceae bacterium]
MAFVDGVLMPGYAVKSAVKMAAFLALPLLLAKTEKEIEIKRFLKFSKNGFGKSLLLGIGIYALITGGYLLLSDVFDFSMIAGSLSENAGVTKENFLFVSLYISFINSLLEEFFFRGFLFMNLRKTLDRKTAHIISAGAFSLYHTAMMLGWFNLPLFVLMLVGLFAGGIIFNLLNEKQGSIYTSWFVHMFANFAINTVGFILLG